MFTIKVKRININMEYYFKILVNMWFYYYSCLPIEDYEYDIYGKLIDKIKNNLELTKEDKILLSKLIYILQFECDYFEIKVLEEIEKII